MVAGAVHELLPQLHDPKLGLDRFPRQVYESHLAIVSKQPATGQVHFEGGVIGEIQA
jgi:hypothetical protein